jgi:hypothetical protein
MELNFIFFLLQLTSNVVLHQPCVSRKNSEDHKQTSTSLVRLNSANCLYTCRIELKCHIILSDHLKDIAGPLLSTGPALAVN